MWNYISRAQSLLTTGPWWWRPVGGAISVGLLVIVYVVLS
jgi:hypothetical protein